MSQCVCLQDASVRETAVTALLELYNDEDKVAPMHELTERFTPRFAQLIHDIHEGVAVKGVSLYWHGACHTFLYQQGLQPSGGLLVTMC